MQFIGSQTKYLMESKIAKYITVVPNSQKTNKFPAASPSNVPDQCKKFLFGEAQLLAVFMLPALETLDAVLDDVVLDNVVLADVVLLDDVVDDGPITFGGVLVVRTIVVGPGVLVVKIALTGLHVKDRALKVPMLTLLHVPSPLIISETCSLQLLSEKKKVTILSAAVI